jgi:anti-sigma regulatory factor (Ser/Thr protein kinase)
MNSLLATEAISEVSPVSTYASCVPIKHACSCPPNVLGCLSIEKEPNSAFIARQFVKAILISKGYGDEAETLMVATSELVTNAVVHAQENEPEPIRLRLLWTEAALRVEVFDSDWHMPIARLVKADDESGRGLYIVKTLTDNLGWYPSGAGKCVWCEVGLKSEKGHE